MNINKTISEINESYRTEKQKAEHKAQVRAPTQ